MENERLDRIRERLLVCPICLDEYKDPRILPCHHSVCLQCLVDYVRLSSCSGCMFRCPQCRTDVFVPQGGLKDLPSNFYVTSIMDEIGSKLYPSICNVCVKETSKFQCVDCDIDICRFCIHKHKLFTHDSLTELNIIKIESVTSSSNLLKSAKYCSVHAEEILQLYCNRCLQPVCISCCCEIHKKHDTEPLQKKLHASRKWLQEEFDFLNAEVRNVETVEMQVTELMDQIESNADKVIRIIKDRSQLFKEHIDELVQSHVKNVLKNQEHDTKQYKDYLSSLQTCCNKMRKGVTFLEDLQDEDMTLEVLDCFEKYKSDLSSAKDAVVNRVLETNKPIFVTKNIKNVAFNLELGTLQFKNVWNRFLDDMSSDTKTVSSRTCFHKIYLQSVYALLIALILMILITVFGNIENGIMQVCTDAYEKLLVIPSFFSA